MKREINCNCDRQFWQKLIGKYEGESVEIVDGIAVRDMVCDGCNKPITVGQQVSAISVFLESENPSPNWHLSFIIPKGEAK